MIEKGRFVFFFFKVEWQLPEVGRKRLLFNRYKEKKSSGDRW